MQFEDVEFRVIDSQSASNNPVKTMMSKVGTQHHVEEDRYKKILKSITGSIGPGEILALMGPSGSGKTTLLRVVGGRLIDNVKGKITYNDIRFNPAVKRRLESFIDISIHVMSFDILTEHKYMLMLHSSVCFVLFSSFSDL